MTNTVPKSAKRQQPKGGSRKGIPNKITADLKSMILGALDQAGGVAYLVGQAHEKPAAFMALVGKVLPMQVTGADGNDLKLNVTVKYVKPSHGS
jgi:hypothetical protein